MIKLSPTTWPICRIIYCTHMSRDMTKPTMWLCAQRRLRSAWASAQSDRSLRCALNGYLRTQAFFMQTSKTLIRLGGCPGWSESLLGAHSFCWFCHVVAHMAVKYSLTYPSCILQFASILDNTSLSTMLNLLCLIVSHYWNLCKQCRTRSDATEPETTLFANK